MRPEPPFWTRIPAEIAADPERVLRWCLRYADEQGHPETAERFEDALAVLRGARVTEVDHFESDGHGSYRGRCGCGWRGPWRDDPADTHADWQWHRHE